MIEENNKVIQNLKIIKIIMKPNLIKQIFKNICFITHYSFPKLQRYNQIRDMVDVQDIPYL